MSTGSFSSRNISNLMSNIGLKLSKFLTTKPDANVWVVE